VVKVRRDAYDQSAEEEVAVYKQSMENYLKEIRKEIRDDNVENTN
jgi:hypothetical protein